MKDRYHMLAVHAFFSQVNGSASNRFGKVDVNEFTQRDTEDRNTPSNKQ